MVRHSEDWWGVLRQGIESEHMGLVRQSLVLLGGLRLGAVWLGAEIELENMGLERHGAERLGGSRPGLVSLGMEIELENMVSHSHGSAGSGSVRLAGVLLGKVRQVSARFGNRITKYWTG